LDNFYAKQHEDGEICREIVRQTGADFGEWVNHEDKPLFSRWGWPGYDEPVGGDRNKPVIYTDRAVPSPNSKLTLDGLNHPILAWAELEHYRVTGNKNRLEQVWPPLVHYYDALRLYLRQGNELYVTDWASMDNSPRNAYLKNGGTGIDISSEMVLFARQLSEIALILGKEDKGREYSAQADQLASAINQKMWDEKRKFYFDLMLNGERAPVMTIAAYWTLLARVATSNQAADLVKELNNPETFGRLNLVPTLAANQKGYDPLGGYWRGSVWAPTDTMIIEGLEEYGYTDLARRIALNHLELAAHVYEKTGTVWENYSPDQIQPGKPAKGDFVGWSGIGPIMYFLEYAIGLRADASHNRLVWRIEPGGRLGCERFRFNGHLVSVTAQPAAAGSQQVAIRIQSDSPFELQTSFQGANKTFAVKAGEQEFDISGTPKQ
jgi:glycogen debranching enzyme